MSNYKEPKMADNTTVTQDEKRGAIEFLIQTPEARPQGTSEIFEKILIHNDDIKRIRSEIESANAALKELERSFNYKNGAIEALVDVALDILPDDKILGWAEDCSVMLGSKNPSQEEVERPEPGPAPKDPEEVETETVTD